LVHAAHAGTRHFFPKAHPGTRRTCRLLWRYMRICRHLRQVLFSWPAHAGFSRVSQKCTRLVPGARRLCRSFYFGTCRVYRFLEVQCASAGTCQFWARAGGCRGRICPCIRGHPGLCRACRHTRHLRVKGKRHRPLVFCPANAACTGSLEIQAASVLSYQITALAERLATGKDIACSRLTTPGGGFSCGNLALAGSPLGRVAALTH
jgi:hypothetical protein